MGDFLRDLGRSIIGGVRTAAAPIVQPRKTATKVGMNVLNPKKKKISGITDLLGLIPDTSVKIADLNETKYKEKEMQNATLSETLNPFSDKWSQARKAGTEKFEHDVKAGESMALLRGIDPFSGHQPKTTRKEMRFDPLMVGKSVSIGKSLGKTITKAAAKGVSAKGINRLIKTGGSVAPKASPLASLVKAESKAGSKASVLDEVKGIFAPKKANQGILATARETAKKTQTAVTSEFAPLKFLERDVLRGAGQKKKPALDLARKFELTKGSEGMIQADVNAYKKAVVDPIRRNADDMNSLLFLKRTKSRLLTDPEARKVGGWSVDKVDQGLQELMRKVGPKKYQKLEEASVAFQKSMDDALQLQVQSGRLSKEMYQTIKASNDFYAPFKVMKYLDEGADVAGSSRNISSMQDLTKAIKGIKDEEFQLQNLLQSGAQYIARSRSLAEKSKAMTELSGLMKLDKSGKYIKALKSDEIAREGYEAIPYFSNGVRKTMEVPKDVATAVKGMTTTQRDFLQTAMHYASQPLRLGATGANLAFQPVNMLLADMPRLAIISKYGVRSPVDLVRFPLDWIRSFAASLKGNFGFSDDLYEQFLRSGAARSTIQRELTPGVFEQTLGIPQKITAGRVATAPLRAAKKATLDVMAKISNAFEETTKIAGLKRGMRIEGLSKLPPAERAKKMQEIVSEVRNFSGSPDFARAGNVSKKLNLLFMFFNARVQGVASDFARLAGAHGGKNAAAAWARLSTAVGVPTTALMLHNLSPENREDYMKIPEWERENNFMIPTDKYFTNNDGERVREYIRIPKREIVKLFSNLIESAVVSAHDKDPQALQRFGVSFLENVSPVNISGKNLTERGESVISSMNPLLKTPAELSMNRNTFQHYDIVPETGFNPVSDRSPKNQYYGTTPDIFKKIGAATNISPLKLQQGLQSTTGGLVTQFLPKKPFEGREDWTTKPVLSRFVRSGLIDDPNVEDRQAAITKQADEKFEFKERAKKEYEKIGSMGPGRGDEYYDSLPEDMQDEIRLMVEKEEKGWGDEEFELNKLQVKNGARAEYIYDRLSKLNPSEAEELYQKWDEGGLISKNVEAQLEELLNQ